MLWLYRFFSVLWWVVFIGGLLILIDISAAVQLGLHLIPMGLYAAWLGVFGFWFITMPAWTLVFGWHERQHGQPPHG